MQDVVVSLNHVANSLGGQVVHTDVSFNVYQKEIFAIMGGSGSGKTTLLRNILMLLTPDQGEVNVFGTNVAHCSSAEAFLIRQRWGVMFQQGALFSNLSVLENIMFLLTEFAKLPKQLCKEIALLKIDLVGLAQSAANKYPAELSGGMLKRAAAARAIALDPELLILDEPTSGLDPKSTEEFDQLLLALRESLGLTVVIVSHDVDSLNRLSDRAAFLGDGRVLAEGPLSDIKQSEVPLIQHYFHAYAEGRRFRHTAPIMPHPLRGTK